MQFLGYERPDGSVGVRNLVAVFPAGKCANELAANIADEATGAIALLHNQPCVRLPKDNERSLRTLVNLGRNANVAAAVVVGIGCDSLSAHDIADGIATSGKPVLAVTIKEAGDYQGALDRGVAAARAMLSEVAQMRRQAYPMSRLTLGIKCGGSDTTSGLASNPAVGKAVDAVLGLGGRAVFAETPEIIGAEHVLCQRAASPQAAEHLREIVARAEKRIKAEGVDIRGSEPTPGNIQGGLTTLEEKSLGAVIKAGTAPLQGVLEYAELPADPGLYFMDSSANTPQVLLGLAAAGAQVLVFAYGGGLPARFRSYPALAGGMPLAPIVKVLANPQDRAEAAYFDIYAGTILNGEETIDQAGERILKEIGAVASGKPTKGDLRSGYREVLELYHTGPIL